jgi:hypothetical protein
MDPETLRRHIVDAFPGTHVMEAHGDLFFLHDPHRDLPPERQQPWATIVTSDHHGDVASQLDRPGVFRLSIGLPRAEFVELFPAGGEHDPAALDIVVPHPVYGALHWVQVLAPDTTWPAARELLTRAQAFPVRKYTNAAARGR